MIQDRRAFLRKTGAALGVVSFLKGDWPTRLAAAERDGGGRGDGGGMGGNESFWFQIQQAFDVDRSIINLNNGGCCPAPRLVMSAQERHLTFTNNAPVRTLWTIMDPQVEHVRARLAKAFGCRPDEMAITRNASEALQIAINGIDMKPGDEYLTTTQDYPRMITTIKQRAEREGVVLKQIKIPTPARSMPEIVSLFEKAITPKTRVILVSHSIFMTGQILPVKEVCALARSRGIWSIVDGAHAFAQFPYNGGEIGCDMYGVSLHKWCTAPIGTGFLYVRKDRIKDVWPLTAAEKPRSDEIRKFEEIGTHPDAGRLAIAEALTFWEGIGAERKADRLRYLRDYWAKRLMKLPNVIMHTSLDPAHSCAIGTIQLKGADSKKLVEHFWDNHKIIVVPITHDEFEGIRVSANVYTSLTELDMFCEAFETVAKNGLPPPKPANGK